MVAPPSLDAVLQLLASGDRAVMAGGTELMVALCAGRLRDKQFVSLNHLRELRFIDESHADMVRIGSGTTFRDIRTSSVLAREFPLLGRTASWTGSVANQNRGTLGGNIANASPAADNPPALLAYSAELELVSASCERLLPYREFHLGYKWTALQPGEIIRAVRLPRRFHSRVHWVRKVGTRNAQAIAKVALAGVAKIQDGRFAEVMLGVASLFDRPARLLAAEAALQGQSVADPRIRIRAQEALLGEVAPIDDIRSTGAYRKQVAANLLDEFLQHCGQV